MAKNPAAEALDRVCEALVDGAGRYSVRDIAALLLLAEALGLKLWEHRTEERLTCGNGGTS